jgi:hypothetical protein
MNLLRYSAVLLLGSLAGAIWAVVFVDFVPQWYEQLWVGLGLTILFLPLVIHFLCGMLVPWWHWRECCIYAAIVMIWWIPGDIHNELVNVGDLSHFPVADQVTLDLFVCATLFLSGFVGNRLERTSMERR